MCLLFSPGKDLQMPITVHGWGGLIRTLWIRPISTIPLGAESTIPQVLMHTPPFQCDRQYPIMFRLVGGRLIRFEPFSRGIVHMNQLDICMIKHGFRDSRH